MKHLQSQHLADAGRRIWNSVILCCREFEDSLGYIKLSQKVWDGKSCINFPNGDV